MNRDAPKEPSREELIALVAAQAAEIAALRARIAELERRLGLNSSNSGKPPSSDGLKKPPRVASLRERCGNKPGGQKGHDGETLRQVAEPDNIIDHFPQACAVCGSTLTPAMATGHSARQVFDLPAPQPPVVTEHRAHDCQCAACGVPLVSDYKEELAECFSPGHEILLFANEQELAEVLRRIVAKQVDLKAIGMAGLERFQKEHTWTHRMAKVLDDCELP